MKKFRKLAFIAILMLFAFLMNTALVSAAGTVDVTVTVTDSHGNPLADVTIYYHDGSYKAAGSTNGAGQLVVTVPETVSTFKAVYESTTEIVTNSDILSDPTVNFVTKLAQVQVVDSFGTAISGAVIQYHAGSYKSFGTTDGSGMAYKELFGTSYTFMASYANTSETQIADISSLITFQTTLVTVHVQDSSTNPIEGVVIQYHAGSYKSFGTTDVAGNASKELFGSSYTFMASYAHTSETQVAAINAPIVFQTKDVLVHVQNSAGAAIEGAQIYYHAGSYKDFGTTDVNGDAHKELFGSSYTFKASYNSTSKTIVEDITNTVVFETIKVTGLVKDCDGNPKEGAAVYYHAGSYKNLGTTGADGKASIEIFEGTYTFKATYHSTSLVLSDVAVSAAAGEVVFHTTQVTIQYPGSVYYHAGSYKLLDGPNFDLFPGTYTFKFDNGITMPILITGCKVEKTVAFVKLIDSLGNPIAGGEASVYNSGWKTIGTTDADGQVAILMDGLKGKLSFKMKYLGAYDKVVQDISVDPCVVFQTVLVDFILTDSDGVDQAGEASFYASGWKTFGPTNTSKELLPVKYTFKVKFNGAYQQLSQNVSVDPVVRFHTTTVTIVLLDSAGGTLSGGEGSFYASGWKSAGTTPSAVVELLPVKYTFKMKYEGAYQQFTQTIAAGASDAVIFQTVKATMSLLDSTGTTELAGEGSFYASGWKTFGITPAERELLPVKYTFKVKYLGAYLQKTQDLSIDPAVVFQTTPVSVVLKASDGVTILPAEASFYASGWKPWQATGTLMEMLPGKYTFKVMYLGAYNQKSVEITGPTTVEFQTTLVTVKILDGSTELAGEASYYASGWKDLGTTTTMNELLPGNYSFKVKYNGAYLKKVQDVGVDPVVIFTGTSVTLHFTGEIQFYASGWKTFTGPTMSLLPGDYTFRFGGSGFPYRKRIITVSGDSMELSVSYIALLDSCGRGLAGGTARFYDSGWQDALGETSSAGVIGLKNGAPSNMQYRMKYLGAEQQKTQNSGVDSFIVFQTTKVEVQLLDSGGAALTGGVVSFYANGWRDFGDANTSLEMLPVSYQFQMVYGGGIQKMNENVSVVNLIVFQTVPVTVELRDSAGDPLAGGTVKYYANGWKTFGDANTTLELLPLSYQFEMTYGGGIQKMTKNVGVVNPIVFQTIAVTVELRDSNDALLPDGTVKYYANGWKTFGDANTTLEMLPLSYQFEMTYKGGIQNMTRDTTVVNPIIFQTAPVTVNLIDHTGAPITSGGTVTYYANGWKTFGNANTTLELLPLSYQFKMNYLGASVSKTINVGLVPMLDFQTGQVSSVSDTVTQFYASSWHTFLNGMEMLGEYRYMFKFSDGHQEAITILPGIVNTID